MTDSLLTEQNNELSESIFNDNSPTDTELLIEQLLLKKRIQLKNLSFDKLIKLSNPSIKVSIVKLKYSLECYNFNTKKYDNISSFSNKNEIQIYLKEHNINCNLNMLIKNNLIKIQNIL